jgi:hypothetical protein
MKKYEEKTFGELKIGERFWTWELDCGDMCLQKEKTDTYHASYSERCPMFADTVYLLDLRVWVEVPSFFNYPIAIILLALIFAVVGTVVLFVKWLFHAGVK